MQKPRAGSIALLVLSLPILAGLFLYGPFVLDLFLHRRPPSRFLVPAGYVGWVRVAYRVPGTPALPREGKYLLVRVDRDGSLQTSTDLASGWGHDQFFSYSGNTRQSLSNAGWCKGGMIWGEAIGKDRDSVTIQKFLVGSEDQFRMEVDPAGKIYNPCG